MCRGCRIKQHQNLTVAEQLRESGIICNANDVSPAEDDVCLARSLEHLRLEDMNVIVALNGRRDVAPDDI